MKPHYRALIVAGLFAGLPAPGQGTGQASAPPSASGTAPQQEPCCPCPMHAHGHGHAHGPQGTAPGQAGPHCPMAGLADVTVEQTPTGAILRLTAKDPSRVADVQRMAQRMEGCMSGTGGARAPSQPQR